MAIKQLPLSSFINCDNSLHVGFSVIRSVERCTGGEVSLRPTVALTLADDTVNHIYGWLSPNVYQDLIVERSGSYWLKIT